MLLSFRLFMVFLCFLLFLTGCLPSGQLPVSRMENHPRGDLSLLWINTENFFHPDNAATTTDDDYTPEGAKHWTFSRYRAKLTFLARLIVAAGRGSPPELVGFAEIEEFRVLEDLVRHPILIPYGYAYIHREGPDHREMEVACLYRDACMKGISWEHIAPPRGPQARTREVLEVACRLKGGRELTLVLAHFISRYRGAAASSVYRGTQVRQLARRCDSLLTSRDSPLVVAGDFNASWSDPLMDPLREDMLIFPEGVQASYRYQGRWSLIDYFLVAGALEDMKLQGWVMKLPVLLCEDEAFGGVKPSRTYVGFSYRGGLSDHLPVVLDINW